jgi:diguanylate cyclase (GGDEF)-like protein
MAGRFGAVRVGGWALMSARHRPAPTPRVEGRPEAARDPRPSLFRRLLVTSAAEATSADAASAAMVGGIAHAMAAEGLPPPSESPSLEEQLAERLDTFLGIAERLAASHDRTALLGMIVDETRRGLGTDDVTIRVLEGGRMRLAAWAGLDDAGAARLPDLGLDEGWVGAVVRSGRVMSWDDARTDPDHGMERYDPEHRWGATIAAPLIHDGEIVGVLNVCTPGPRAWTDGDVAFLATLATHAAIALTNAKLLSETERRAAQLATLQAASARLTRAGSVEGVGRTVVEEARRIIDYHNARVYLIEADEAVVPIAFEGRVGAYEQVDFSLLRCRIGEGFTGWVALHGEPILANDAGSDPRGLTIDGTDDIDESMLVVPMRYDGVTVGVITLSKLGLDGFTDGDLQLLTILADQAATAMESARLLTRSQALAGELRRLLDMSSELSGSLDPRQVANRIAEHLATAMAADECAISYWDRPSGKVESLGYFPALRIEQLEPFFLVEGFPETIRALERQETVIIDAADPDADPAEVALLTRDGNRMLAMLPLVAKGQSIGLVELFSRSALRWDREQLDLARTMANEAAMALENARLYEDARKLADRDPLTSFYNHRFLHERLGEEVVRSQRARRPLSVLMLDLDDFKLVNDTFGHLFGDRVLVWCAELIRSTLRGSDIPARYGGDEFAVILPDTDADDARIAAERILDAFRDRPYIGEQRGPVPLAGSIGIATFPADGRTATDLIAAADEALYRVKRDGGHEAAAASDGAAA